SLYPSGNCPDSAIDCSARRNCSFKMSTLVLSRQYSVSNGTVAASNQSDGFVFTIARHNSASAALNTSGAGGRQSAISETTAKLAADFLPPLVFICCNVAQEG